MSIELGSNATVSWDRTAGHTVTLSITKPDGTLNTPTVTSVAGKFSAIFAASLAGRYLLTWLDDTDDVKYTDIVEVWPADPRFLVSTNEALAQLKWNNATVAASTDQLRLYVAAATPIIEDITGAILQRTVEQYADGGRTGVALWERPDEIISVEVDDTLVTDYVLNKNAAIVYRGRHGERFRDGTQIVKVTYSTGFDQIPPNVKLATLELIRHLWQIGQQISQGAPVEYGSRPMGTTPSGFAVPNRVLELCSSTYSLPGMA